MINHATSSNLYRSYYPHRLRELVSPACGIFFSQPLHNCIGPTIRIGREILCLPDAGFLSVNEAMPWIKNTLKEGDDINCKP